MKTLFKFCFLIAALLTANFTIAQTAGKDTINPGKVNDPMVINPGKPQDGMSVDPGKANDGMSVLTDTGFISRNLHDNLMEIQLAKLAVSKGSPQVKKVANQIITDHNQMLAALRKLAAQKGLTEPKAGSMSPLPPMEQGVAGSFDSKWSSAMLTMHSHKIEELEKYQVVTQDKDLKLLIGMALPKIRAHRAMLAKLPGAKEIAGPGTAVQ